MKSHIAFIQIPAVAKLIQLESETLDRKLVIQHMLSHQFASVEDDFQDPVDTQIYRCSNSLFKDGITFAHDLYTSP